MFYKLDEVYVDILCRIIAIT